MRKGLTLLEVLLALAILGGALAVIGELSRIAARNAEQARDLSTAQRLCENKMAEIAAEIVRLAGCEEREAERYQSSHGLVVPRAGGPWVTAPS